MAKHTPLFDIHMALNAHMAPFSDWDMPIYYSNLMAEHLATRTQAGLFDICHMGEIFITGCDAFLFLQFVLTNDVAKLSDGQCFYSTMCDETGGTVDDVFLYRFSSDRYMLVVNADNILSDLSHLRENSSSFNVIIDDQSTYWAKLDLQGPNAVAILQRICSFDLLQLVRFHFVDTTVMNIPMIVSRTGYTGEDGFELYFDAQFASVVWNGLLESGQSFGLVPVGLGARDTLRIEACYSLYGHELSPVISPVQAGIGFVVRDKVDDYLGKKVLLEQKLKGTDQQLICFEMSDKSIPRAGYGIYCQDDRIGSVSSGTFSPSFKKGIGMGFVGQVCELGDQIGVDIRGSIHLATVVKRPFYLFRSHESAFAFEKS